MPRKLDFNTLAELIHSLGQRGETAKALDINYRTLTTRTTNPSTFTVGELQKLADLADTTLQEVTRLAEQQIKNPVTPPAPVLGRPPRQQ